MFKQCIYEEVVLSKKTSKHDIKKKRGVILQFLLDPKTQKTYAVIEKEDGSLTECNLNGIEVVR